MKFHYETLALWYREVKVNCNELVEDTRIMYKGYPHHDDACGHQDSAIMTAVKCVLNAVKTIRFEIKKYKIF